MSCYYSNNSYCKCGKGNQNYSQGYNYESEEREEDYSSGQNCFYPSNWQENSQDECEYKHSYWGMKPESGCYNKREERECGYKEKNREEPYWCCCRKRQEKTSWDCEEEKPKQKRRCCFCSFFNCFK
jgi:hypothetical protein